MNFRKSCGSLGVRIIYLIQRRRVENEIEKLQEQKNHRLQPEKDIKMVFNV